MDTTHAWGNPPTTAELEASFELSAMEFAKLLLRTCHLPPRAWTDHATLLRRVYAHGADHSDEWVQLLVASLEKFPESGAVVTDTEKLKSVAGRLLKGLEGRLLSSPGSSQPSTLDSGPRVPPFEFTLRRAQPSSTSEHFALRPSALARLEDQFRPLEDPAQHASSTASASSVPGAVVHVASGTATKISSCGGGGGASGVERAAAGYPAGAPTNTGSSVLLGSRSAGGWRTSGNTSLGRNSGTSARMNAAGGAKKSRMMMMDAGEAAQLHAASVAAAKPKERTKKEPKKPTTAPSAEATDRTGAGTSITHLD